MFPEAVEAFRDGREQGDGFRQTVKWDGIKPLEVEVGEDEGGIGEGGEGPYPWLPIKNAKYCFTPIKFMYISSAFNIYL